MCFGVIEIAVLFKGEKMNVVGKCPNCGGKVVESKFFYGCQNWRKEDGACSFKLHKVLAQKKISPLTIQVLLEKGKSEKIKGFKSNKGETFSAALKLIKADRYWFLKFVA